MTKSNALLLTIAVQVILFLINLLLFKYLNKSWWKKKIIKHFFIFIETVGIIVTSIIYMIDSFKLKMISFETILYTVVYFIVVVNISFILVFLLSGILNTFNDLIEKMLKKRKIKTGRVELTRRTLFKIAAVSIPVIVAKSNVIGLTNAFDSPVIKEIELKYEDLPKELKDLKILHLSDIHLGNYFNLDDLDALINRLKKYKFDLILITGDLADEIDLLEPALENIHSLSPKYGSYASIGNHEYPRGINKVISIFNKSPIKLLYNEGISITINDNTVFLGGADDPRVMLLEQPNRDLFYNSTLSKAFAKAEDNNFRILLSHRPEAFDYCYDYKIDLTLSGHTHGGQIGYDGKSFGEYIAPQKYMWGLYKKDNHLCYVTSGVGHWLPFRIGCPTEACIHILK